jgi:hypothetical protein
MNNQNFDFEQILQLLNTYRNKVNENPKKIKKILCGKFSLVSESSIRSLMMLTSFYQLPASAVIDFSGAHFSKDQLCSYLVPEISKHEINWWRKIINNTLKYFLSFSIFQKSFIKNMGFTSILYIIFKIWIYLIDKVSNLGIEAVQNSTVSSTVASVNSTILSATASAASNATDSLSTLVSAASYLFGVSSATLSSVLGFVTIYIGFNIARMFFVSSMYALIFENMGSLEFKSLKELVEAITNFEHRGLKSTTDSSELVKECGVEEQNVQDNVSSFELYKFRKTLLSKGDIPKINSLGYYLGIMRLRRLKAIHFFRPDGKPRSSRAEICKAIASYPMSGRAMHFIEKFDPLPYLLPKSVQAKLQAYKLSF